MTLGLSCVLGLTINHSTFVCTRYNEPLTTSVAGSLKNILMTLIGAVSFGDFVYAKWNVVGLGLSMAGRHLVRHQGGHQGAFPPFRI